MAVSAIPIVIAGRTPSIAVNVKAGLAPKYEVMHTLLSLQEATSHLPYLLKGQAPPADEHDSNLLHPEISMRNYTRAPRAVVLGAGYGDRDVKMIREVCESADVKAADIPWLRPTSSIKGWLVLGFDSFAAQVARRVHTCLDRTLSEEPVKGAEKVLGEIVWY